MKVILVVFTVDVTYVGGCLRDADGSADDNNVPWFVAALLSRRHVRYRRTTISLPRTTQLNVIIVILFSE